VQELRNAVRRAILLASDVIEPEQLSVLPVDPSPAPPLRGAPAPVDSSLKEIAEAAAAHADYKTLHLKMKKYRINPAQVREHVSASSPA